MDALAPYRVKRDFKSTSEPSGGEMAKPGAARDTGGIFVIHKHDATRLHYDLRLEHGGVLWSWAVTRGPSLDPHEKRLAVHVEDHPLDYAPFEGTIPAGSYGAGSVIVWDRGTWTPEFDPQAGMKKGHLRFTLDGEKLNGAWHLVRLKRRPKEKRDNWLLIKSEDAAARADGDILEELPASVATGRTIEDIAAGVPAKKAAPKKTGAPGQARPERKTRAKAKPLGEMPGFIAPALATLKSVPPSGADWLHEVKFDGYRMQAHLSGGEVTLHTRSGLDWTHRFGSRIREALAALPCGQVVLDGEIVVLSDAGAASFSALQAALSAGRTDRMIFYLFDILHLDGDDLRGEPLVERKHRLETLLAGLDPETAPLRYSEHFVEPGQTMLRHACRMGLEGVVSKLADSPYASGRSFDWIKSKCTQRQEFVIVGYLPSTATGRGLRSLLLGYHRGGVLHYAGRVGTGFSSAAANDLKERLDALVVKKRTVEHPEARDRAIVWVEPKLVAEVEFRAWTDSGILRHSSFQGLREDKPAEEVVAEIPVDAKDKSQPGKGGKSGAKAKTEAKLQATSITLSKPDKVLWPEAGITKQGMLDHYALVWPRMKPFVVRRPLSLVRAPDGVAGAQRFFQKHASKGMNEAIRILPDPTDGEDLLYVEDFDGIAALVQMGVVEIHIWGSTIGALEQPDQVVFDLDPDEGLGVEAVIAATMDVKRRLDDLGFKSFVKTSGGKGYHVVMPLKPKADWAEVKAFSHDFARAMEQAEPDRYTATLAKKARTGRIFIDYLRNGRGATAVAPWSTRAKPNASVAVPVTFDQIEGGLLPDHFQVAQDTIRAALAAADPWAGFFKAGKPLKTD